jgi:hypothetical protein
MGTSVCIDAGFIIIAVIIVIYLIWQQSNKVIENKAISEQKLEGVTQSSQMRLNDSVIMRDQAVISSPLYPPIGRTERPIFDNIQNHFNYPTRDSQDTYRLIGYLVNKTTEDLGSNVWRLFGRQKFRGSSQGEFYAIPSHGDRQDIKVQLEDSMFVGEKIRDIYALPNKVRINSPFFSSDEYDVVQLPKPDFTSPYI